MIHFNIFRNLQIYSVHMIMCNFSFPDACLRCQAENKQEDCVGMSFIVEHHIKIDGCMEPNEQLSLLAVIFCLSC